MIATVGDIVVNPIFIDSTQPDNRPDYLEIVPTREEDIELLSKMFQVSLWLMMVMNAEPQWIEPHTVSCHRKPSKAHDDGWARDLWYPNFLGRNYTLPTIPLGGTHASPRYHPRRGHWTHQPYGPKSTLRKLKWLRRMFVGATP